jgi:hypothetical protein
LSKINSERFRNGLKILHKKAAIAFEDLDQRTDDMKDAPMTPCLSAFVKGAGLPKC